jgi:hypothetical protein
MSQEQEYVAYEHELPPWLVLVVHRTRPMSTGWFGVLEAQILRDGLPVRRRARYSHRAPGAEKEAARAYGEEMLAAYLQEAADGEGA